MKHFTIADSLLQKCLSTAEAYLQKTRAWAKDDYEIKFYFIEDKKNIAVFGVIHKQGKSEILQRLQATGEARQGWHPLEVTLIIDIVDLTVLSENESDTVYPHEVK